MKREITEKVRYVMDELVPPAIRDSRWFMWPFFVMAYGTFAVRPFMEFKSRAYAMTAEDYRNFYASLGNSISRRRISDLNEASVRFITEQLCHTSGTSLLDVGTGNGYLLSRLSGERAWRRLAGVDVVAVTGESTHFEFHEGMLPLLPFADHEFDVVTCTHVVEHLLDVEASIKELLRITRRQLFIVLPRQRYYFYTLDEHLNFYPHIEPLLRLLQPHQVRHELRGGDWAIAVTPAMQTAAP